jgi:hypothetical protein
MLTSHLRDEEFYGEEKKSNSREMALNFRYKNEINCLENYHSASAFHLIHISIFHLQLLKSFVNLKSFHHESFRGSFICGVLCESDWRFGKRTKGQH